MSLKTRLDRLEGERRQPTRRYTIWDLFIGTLPDNVPVEEVENWEEIKLTLQEIERKRNEPDPIEERLREEPTP